jgi:hypothetical protein
MDGYLFPALQGETRRAQQDADKSALSGSNACPISISQGDRNGHGLSSEKIVHGDSQSFTIHS